MKNNLLRIIAILLMVWLPCCTIAQQSSPVPIIFDTDIAPDYDDVGALALLHALANNGEANILATISSNAFETTVPTLSVINQYFRRPAIPIGITHKENPNKDCSQHWAQAIIAQYPHAISSNAQATEAIALYRQILSVQPDKSVTIVSVGFFTNLAGLLASNPDAYSPLSGAALVSKKVKQLVSMATRLGEDGKTGYEFNVQVDAAAAKNVLSNWPTPIILSGFEIGEKILTGMRLIQNEGIQNSPVKTAFTVALLADNNRLGRNSWDETAVLVAVRGLAPYFDYRKLNFEIKEDGQNVLIPGEKFIYLQFRQSPEAIGRVIEDLMMQQPLKK
jgi:inosine-uridine nucleoside N-ribohydrolase